MAIRLPEINIGWFVGWVETRNATYCFASNIQAPKANKQLLKARIEAARNILNHLLTI